MSDDIGSGAESLALKFNRESRGHTVADVLAAGVAIACYAAKAGGASALDVQKLVVKTWGTLPDEITGTLHG